MHKMTCANVFTAENGNFEKFFSILRMEEESEEVPNFSLGIKFLAVQKKNTSDENEAQPTRFATL